MAASVLQYVNGLYDVIRSNSRSRFNGLSGMLQYTSVHIVYFSVKVYKSIFEKHITLIMY